MKQPFIANKYMVQEDKDIANYKVFMDCFPLNYFITAATVQGCWFDIGSQNRTGGTIVTELKGRDSKVLGYESIMIEPEKLERLVRAWEKGGIWSFYANIIEDSKIMYIFFIPGIIHLIPEFNVVENMKIPFDFNGHIEYKYEDRVFIPKEYGYTVDFSGDIPEVKMAKDNVKVAPPKRYEIDFTRKISARDIDFYEQETETDNKTDS